MEEHPGFIKGWLMLLKGKLGQE
ncbi:hypothetical protein QN277_026005 [Acacia crassicarpa]|uniref:Uncharacterized protein n=1 Tax=Acacia crassicarpa TaxID=499986 RepID=A0AAE1JB51_9FABA|nr:hypothetical protein QN277_026005 [Acacia crassicarpa]